MSLNPILRRRGQGEILKAERMLVRIERIDNPNQKLPADYNEGTSVDTRLKRAWREYYVVARIGQNASKHVTLYIHKSRVVSPFSGLMIANSCDDAYAYWQGCSVGNQT
jgi:hypothetical protein